MAQKDQGSGDSKAIREIMKQVNDIELRLKDAEQQLVLFN